MTEDRFGEELNKLEDAMHRAEVRNHGRKVHVLPEAWCAMCHEYDALMTQFQPGEND